MSGHVCPGCNSPPAVPVGAPFVGAVGFLWWKRTFEEQLYRCSEGHVYSARVTADGTELELHEDVEAWLRARIGAEGPTRPPGL